METLKTKFVPEKKIEKKEIVRARNIYFCWNEETLEFLDFTKATDF